MKWTKESGIEIETNDLDATLKYCLSLGWIPAEIEEEPVKVEPEKKKPGRPKKVEEVDTAKVFEG